MPRYRIANGVAKFTAEEVVEITEQQFKPRAHNVDVVGRKGDVISVKVKPGSELHFKPGEIIGLPALPRRLAPMLEPVDRQKSADAKAKADAVAAA